MCPLPRLTYPNSTTATHTPLPLPPPSRLTRHILYSYGKWEDFGNGAEFLGTRPRVRKEIHVQHIRRTASGSIFRYRPSLTTTKVRPWRTCALGRTPTQAFHLIIDFNFCYNPSSVHRKPGAPEGLVTRGG